MVNNLFPLDRIHSDISYLFSSVSLGNAGGFDMTQGETLPSLSRQVLHEF